MHGETLVTQLGIGHLLALRGRAAEAEKIFLETQATARKTGPANQTLVARSFTELAALALSQGDRPMARELLQKARHAGGGSIVCPQSCTWMGMANDPRLAELR
jgi:hypothetical protein